MPAATHVHPIESTADLVAAAADRLRAAWPLRPVAVVILGTGLGGLADLIAADVAFDYGDLPGFPHSTALAHPGRLVCGTLGGAAVVALQGRVHYYEGYHFQQITHATRVAARLGAETLIVSNASGGINPQFRAGDIMLIEDHIDLMGTRNAIEPGPSGNAPRSPTGTDYYDGELLDRMQQAAIRHGFACRQGVYVGVTGPNYETRAEYRAFRKLGGDVVGMSTIPEVIAARRLGLRVAALSVVTNVARPDAPDLVDAHEVVDIAASAAPRLNGLVASLLAELSATAAAP